MIKLINEKIREGKLDEVFDLFKKLKLDTEFKKVVTINQSRYSNLKLSRQKGLPDISSEQRIIESNLLDLLDSLDLETKDSTQEKNKEYFKELFQRRKYSKATVKSYTSYMIHLVEAFKHRIDVDSLTFNDLSKYIANDLIKVRKLKGQAINIAINTLKSYYNDILGYDYDFKSIIRPKRNVEVANTISISEIKRLLDAFDNSKHKLIFTLLYSCILEVNDLLKIRIADVDLVKYVIKIRDRKDKISREVIIGEFEKQLIEQYLIAFKPEKLLFESTKPGVPYGMRSIQELIKRVFKDLKLDEKITVRTIKYSAVKHLNEKGYNFKSILDYIGQSARGSGVRYISFTGVSGETIDKSLIDVITHDELKLVRMIEKMKEKGLSDSDVHEILELNAEEIETLYLNIKFKPAAHTVRTKRRY